LHHYRWPSLVSKDDDGPYLHIYNKGKDSPSLYMSVQPFDIQSVCFISFYLFKTIPVGKFSSFTAILSPSAAFSGSREIEDILY